MHPERWARLEPHIDELLTLPPLERARRIDEIAANDPGTAAELHELLSANDEASRVAFLGTPALPAFVAAAAAAGDELGPWTLAQPIGEGGMGSVWRARRSDGRFEGEAAVKLLKSGLFDAAAQERFRREGAILARLRHPGIAQLLDAGITAKGQPYLVLELVQGERIDEWCETHSPGVRQRVELFLQALEAVAAAHGQLVIHRDLKPTNILVNQAGHVKLLDFGIARLLPSQDDAAEQTALTRAGAFALTPPYAAPEQFEGGVLGMATDVFSLGTVLYELLTKAHPSGLAAGRAPGERRALRGDLDNILAKALAPLAANRYSSVAAFADDLRRHLNDQPVLAQPGPLAYRIGKFVRRNRLAVAASAAVFAALAVGIAATLWMGAEAARQRDIAVGEAKRARQAETQAKAVQGFLIDLFAANALEQHDPQAAQNLTARELLDRGAKKLDAGALAGQPASQLEIAKVLASIYGELVLGEQQLRFLRRQVALSESLNGPDAIETANAYAALAGAIKLEDRKGALDSGLHAERIYDARKEHSSPDYGMLQITLSELLNSTDLDAAERHARIALQVFAATPSDIRYGLASTRLGLVMYFRGRMADAETSYQKAVGIYEAAGDEANPLITAAYANLGRIQEMRLEFDPAEQNYRRAVGSAMRINGPYHPSTVVFRGDYAYALAEMSRLPEALAVARENETALRSAPAEQQTRWSRSVQNVLGNMEAQSGLVEDAGKHLEAAAVAEKAANPTGRRTAEMALSAASAAIERGDLDRAAQQMTTVHAYLDSAAAGTAASTRALAIHVGARLEAARGHCAEALASLGPPTAARAYATQVEFRDAAGEAELRADCKDVGNADTTAAALLAAIEARQLQRPLALNAAQAEVVRARVALGRHDATAAERYLRLALPVQAAQYDAASPTLADSRLLSACALSEQGKTAQAQELLKSARAALARHPALAASHARLLDETTRLVALR
jgi:eukaryotic-like serine/threonine-protein kinase